MLQMKRGISGYRDLVNILAGSGCLGRLDTLCPSGNSIILGDGYGERWDDIGMGDSVPHHGMDLAANLLDRLCRDGGES